MQRWLAAVGAVALIASAGCAGSDDAAPSGSAGSPPPSLGGTVEAPATPPAEPMDELERPIADLLATRLDQHGLSLDHLSCPERGREAPTVLVCSGYFDGITGDVEVHLTRGRGGAVEFDAQLGSGVIATASLVRRLQDQGYTDVDCGDQAAYRSEVGSRLVCSVNDGGTTKYLVATVVDSAGSVEIEDY